MTFRVILINVYKQKKKPQKTKKQKKSFVKHHKISGINIFVISLGQD